MPFNSIGDTADGLASDETWAFVAVPLSGPGAGAGWRPHPQQAAINTTIVRVLFIIVSLQDD